MIFYKPISFLHSLLRDEKIFTFLLRDVPLRALAER